MCPNTCFLRTNYSLSRYNAKGELDCFKCKAGVFSDYSLQRLEKKAITIHVFAKKIISFMGNILTIIKKLKSKCSQGTHCCINRVLSNSTNNASTQLTLFWMGFGRTLYWTGGKKAPQVNSTISCLRTTKLSRNTV